MEVVVYTKPGCDNSQRIKQLLEDRGVEFQEHICADGKLDPAKLNGVQIEAGEVPVTVIDGVAIAGMDRAQIEQAIGWVGF